MKKDLKLTAYKKKGQSLLEVIFALAIILLVVLALVQIVTGAIRSSDFAQKSSQATAYAQRAMEEIRSYRDKNTWVVFSSACTSRNFGLTSPDPATTGFTLAVVSCADEGSVNQKKVVLKVEWTDSTTTHKSELTSFFSNWK
jgi:Tfp pilus assembly protein PilV